MFKDNSTIWILENPMSTTNLKGTIKSTRIFYLQKKKKKSKVKTLDRDNISSVNICKNINQEMMAQLILRFNFAFCWWFSLRDNVRPSFGIRQHSLFGIIKTNDK